MAPLNVNHILNQYTLIFFFFYETKTVTSLKSRVCLHRGLFPQEPLEQCPYDPDHRVPAGRMDTHQLSCSLRMMGYSAREQVRARARARALKQNVPGGSWPTLDFTPALIGNIPCVAGRDGGYVCLLSEEPRAEPHHGWVFIPPFRWWKVQFGARRAENSLNAFC